MSLLLPWRGVRLRVFDVGADPDAPTRRVAIPAAWEEAAARGFVTLLGAQGERGWEAARLPDRAERWIGRLDAEARATGRAADLGSALHRLLLQRQAAPDEWAWQGETEDAFSFVLHLAAFAEPSVGLDTDGLDGAIAALRAALSSVSGPKRRVLRVAGLDGMLASLGLAYDSEAGRDIAADLLRRIRAALELAETPIALAATEGGAADALLGVETSGIAAPFAPLGPDGMLSGASEARLAALGLSSERALAQVLGGRNPFGMPSPSAEDAMRGALASLFDVLPPRLVTDGRTPRREEPARAPRRLPARAKGFTQKVTIGSQRVFLRTAEFEDGTLGEVAVTAGGVRAPLDLVSAMINVGLQHGVPLAAYADLLSGTRFGPQGAVDGDPAVLFATSPLDYAIRALSDAYDGRRLPDPVPPSADMAADADPLLPLALPSSPDLQTGSGRKRHLRLVSTS